MHGGGGDGGGGNEGAPSHKRNRVTARTNNSHEASFDHHALDHPFAQGAFRWVAKGRYVEGARAGEVRVPSFCVIARTDGVRHAQRSAGCKWFGIAAALRRCQRATQPTSFRIHTHTGTQAAVTKWFKDGHHFEAEFFDLDIKAVDKAIQLVREFNNQAIIGSVIRMNKPEVWTFKESAIGWAGRKTLTEPFIQNWQKFNSNTGWNESDVPWGRVMQVSPPVCATCACTRADVALVDDAPPWPSPPLR